MIAAEGAPSRPSRTVRNTTFLCDARRGERRDGARSAAGAAVQNSATPTTAPPTPHARTADVDFEAGNVEAPTFLLLLFSSVSLLCSRRRALVFILASLAHPSPRPLVVRCSWLDRRWRGGSNRVVPLDKKSTHTGSSRRLLVRHCVRCICMWKQWFC